MFVDYHGIVELADYLESLYPFSAILPQREITNQSDVRNGALTTLWLENWTKGVGFVPKLV